MFGERHALYVQLAPPEGSEFATFGSGTGGFALSPDGKTVAFIAKTNGKTGLWVRDVDRPTARLLPGTEGAGVPTWSPDSKSIAFNVPGKLQRVELSGGAPLTICERCGSAGAWTDDGRIILGFGNYPGLVQVPASGGTVSDFSEPDESRGEIRHVYPQIISHDRIMYWAGNRKVADSAVYVASLSNPADRVKILTSISNAVYAADNGGKGYLLFIRGANLMAQEFDAASRKLGGEPRAIADSVAYTGTLGRAEVSASTAGSLLYTSPIRYQFTWFDRSGKPLGKVGDLGEYITFRLSPDGHRIVASRDLPGGTDLWMIDIDRGSASRFTFTGTYHFPVWSPDSKALIFSSFADSQTLYRKNMSGSANEERIEFSTKRGHTAYDWSRDGRSFLYSDARNLWVAPVHPDGSLAGTPTAYFVMEPFRVLAARFSPEPNPHWVAYQSNESGRDDVYVQAFPQAKGKIQISTDGGRLPEWSPDRKEIFYVSPDYNLTAVSIKITGDTVEPSAPHELFHLPAMDLNAGISPYAVADAQKFLVRVTPQQFINLIVDWPALLNKSAPAQ
jgi:Tol biopolymer transport system component